MRLGRCVWDVAFACPKIRHHAPGLEFMNAQKISMLALNDLMYLITPTPIAKVNQTIDNISQLTVSSPNMDAIRL